MRVCELSFDFTDALSDALLNASSDWDVRFTKDLLAKHNEWGDEMYISRAQIEQLERINGV